MRKKRRNAGELFEGPFALVSSLTGHAGGTLRDMARSGRRSLGHTRRRRRGMSRMLRRARTLRRVVRVASTAITVGGAVASATRQLRSSDNGREHASGPAGDEGQSVTSMEGRSASDRTGGTRHARSGSSRSSSGSSARRTPSARRASSARRH